METLDLRIYQKMQKIIISLPSDLENITISIKFELSITTQKLMLNTLYR